MYFVYRTVDEQQVCLVELSRIFWNAQVEDIARGFVHDAATGRYVCLICGRDYQAGFVYSFGESLCQADKAVELHVARDHEPVFDLLLEMTRQYPGITDLQRELLRQFRDGQDDRVIAKAIGAGSASTVRNHRFKLREREKQAKVFLALMSLLAEPRRGSEELIPIHRTARMVDERFAVTEEERKAIIERHFESAGAGPLRSWPTKEKRKVVVLQHIAKRFAPERRYTEREVNEVIQVLYADFVTIRRYLIEYGFLDRTKDGSAYWVKV